jgi:hypothetical protein
MVSMLPITAILTRIPTDLGPMAAALIVTAPVYY